MVARQRRACYVLRACDRGQSRRAMCFAHAREASLPPSPPTPRLFHVTRFLILPAGIPKLLEFKLLDLRSVRISYSERLPPPPRGSHPAPIPQITTGPTATSHPTNFQKPKGQKNRCFELKSIAFSDKTRCRNLATKWLGKRK